MNTDAQQRAALEAIGEANTEQLAEIMHGALRAHGQFGREVTEGLLALLQDDLADQTYPREALAQLSDLEGVLDGRLDAL